MDTHPKPGKLFGRVFLVIVFNSLDLNISHKDLEGIGSSNGTDDSNRSTPRKTHDRILVCEPGGGTLGNALDRTGSVQVRVFVDDAASGGQCSSGMHIF